MARRPAYRTRKPPRQLAGRLPVDLFFRHRRRVQAGGLVVALLVILLLVVLDHYGVGLYATGDLRKYDGQTFEVLRVVDGDTLVLKVADGDERTTRVRVWGVDTPELARQDGSKPAEPLAAEAAAFTRAFVSGGRVTLRLEPHRLRGGYGRLLAHVDRADGTPLGPALIRAGLSKNDDRWSHRHLAEYAAHELEAQREEVGLWAP